MPADLVWRQHVADRALAVTALRDDGTPTLFNNSTTPDCFCLKEKAWCEECQAWVPNAHCPTIRTGFFCSRHCPVCRTGTAMPQVVANG